MKPDVAVAGDTLAVIRRKLDSAGGDAAARESIRRHCEHLESLAANLRRLGMDEHDIGDEIMQVFRQYERALNNYIEAA